MHFTGNPGIVTPVEIAIIASVLLLLLLLLVAFLCIFKKRRSKRRAGKVTKCDGPNPTYGKYFDPDARMEVTDSNAYYSSSDYEAGTGRSRATDNNPYYE